MIQKVGAILLLVLASAASAATIDADVCLTPAGQMGLKPSGQFNCLPVTFLNSIADKDFRELAVGDSATISGTKTSYPYTIEVVSIDVVFLKRLLGTWRDTSGRYYRFSDFSTLLKYDPSLPPNETPVTISYELYPNSKDRWNVIFDEPSETQVGILREYFDKFANYHIEICIYHSPSQRKRECAVLSRLVQ